MEKRNYRGLKKYEPLLSTVCRTNDPHHLSEKEWEGLLGVACVISVIEDVTPNLFALSKHLDIPHYNHNLQKAYERLKINGILSNKKKLKEDSLLTGNGEDSRWMNGAERERNAWCNIAGIASGFIGIREEFPEKK